MNHLLQQFSHSLRSITSLISYHESGEIPIDSIAYESRNALQKIGVL